MVSSIVCNLTRNPSNSSIGKSSHVRTQFDQRLFVGGVSETTHVHLDGKILEFVPPFDHGTKRRQSNHDKTIVPHGSDHHAKTHGQQGQPVEKTVIPFVSVKHLAPIPPLAMIIGKQSVQSMEGVWVERVGVFSVRSIQ